MRNKDKFTESMVVLCEVFDKKMSTILLEVYWKTLKPFSDEECEMAFKQILATAKFFPKPADFLEVLNGSKEDKALNAWLLVEKIVKTIGPYRSVKFKDPIIHSVIDSLGRWSAFQNCTNGEWKWRQKEFVARYKAMSNKTEHPKYLPGITEVENNFGGFCDFVEAPLAISQLKSEKVKMIEPLRIEGH